MKGPDEAESCQGSGLLCVCQEVLGHMSGGAVHFTWVLKDCPGERYEQGGREACQKAAAVVQARDDGAALVISWPWDQRRDQAQHLLSCIRKRAAVLLRA